LSEERDTSSDAWSCALAEGWAGDDKGVSAAAVASWIDGYEHGTCYTSMVQETNSMQLSHGKEKNASESLEFREAYMILASL
jgi:hypothetical protein